MRSALSIAMVGMLALSAMAGIPIASAASRPSDATTYGPPNAADATGSGGLPPAETALRSNESACAPVANGSVRAAPDEDRLGWENGCWANTSIDVTRGNGLNETELDAVVARAMARVEAVRGLEFERTVPVEIVSRAEFRNSTFGGNETGTNRTRANRLHQNVKWEAMFMVGESTDAVAVQRSTTGSTVGGFYSPTDERIVIVSENTTAPKMNEVTLSQELFHALQDQRFNISSFNQTTRELHNAKDGIIEGDGNLVDRLYGKRCEAEWDCLMPRPSQGGGGGATDIHWGMYLVSYQPYSDGPPFVKSIYRDGGWSAVDDVYRNPPASTEQTIHPEKYPEDAPTDVSVEDTSDEKWRVLDLGPNSVDFAQFGEAGLASMLFYPYYDSGRTETPIIGVRSFFNITASGGVSQYDPINYSNKYTAGWDGEKLYPYVTDDSYETNETGYVWKTAWDSERDAAQFVDGYEQLLAYHDARPVDGRENTYVIESGPYADAFSVNHTGSTVTIVNAPSVAELSGVHASAAPENGTDRDTATDGSEGGTETDSTPTDDDTVTDATATDDAGAGGATATATEEPMADDGGAGAGDGAGTEAPAGETTASGGPGFGGGPALAALALAALALRRRE